MNKLLALAVSAAFAGAAHAQTVQSVTYNSNPNAISNQSTDYSTTMSLQQFNPTMGTLQSIVFSLTGTISGMLQGENTSVNSAKTVTLTLGANISLQDPQGNNLVVVVPTEAFTTTLAKYDGTTDYAGTSGITYSGLGTSSSNTSTYTAAANAALLALFTGTGYVNSIFDVEASSGSSAGGNFSFNSVTNGGGSAQVTYNYLVASVPEPATWVMMIGGFGLVGFGMRRKGFAAVLN